MHIPDGFLDSKTWITCAALSAGGIGLALKRTKEELDERQIPLIGVMAAFVFAAQMINFPIPGGTSGHLVGAVLSAVLFGPWVAVLIMTTILGIQCFIFVDGGVTALGANVLNMAVIAPLGGYAVFRLMKPFGLAPAVFVASWFSVFVAAAACAVELALSGIPLLVVLPAMAFWHIIIGLGEGLITTAVILYLIKAHSDILPRLTEAAKPVAHAALKRGVLVMLIVSFAVAGLLSPFASPSPDGLERVAEDKGFLERGIALIASPFADYTFPGLAEHPVGTAAAGIIGTVLTFLAGYAVFRVQRKRSNNAKHSASLH